MLPSLRYATAQLLIGVAVVAGLTRNIWSPEIYCPPGPYIVEYIVPPDRMLLKQYMVPLI